MFVSIELQAKCCRTHGGTKPAVALQPHEILRTNARVRFGGSYLSICQVGFVAGLPDWPRQVDVRSTSITQAHASSLVFTLLGTVHLISYSSTTNVQVSHAFTCVGIALTRQWQGNIDAFRTWSMVIVSTTTRQYVCLSYVCCDQVIFTSTGGIICGRRALVMATVRARWREYMH